MADQEMFRVFNCGIGMVVVLAQADAEQALASLQAAGEIAYRIGHIRGRRADEAQTSIA